MFTITNVAWLNGGRVGIVEVYDHQMHRNKYYIYGFGSATSSMKFDALQAASYGQKLDEELAKPILAKYGSPILINYH